MAELKEYKAVVNGTETTLVLSDDDAKARGLTGGKARKDTHEVPEANQDQAELGSKSGSAEGDKARTAQNK